MTNGPTMMEHSSLYPNPDVSRRPKQTFYVQIKGTRNYSESEGIIKYSLKRSCFPRIYL